jgi:uncharacterized SAM-binding protein YcdF (DUF218 family)
VTPPLFSFQILVGLLIGFFVLIGFVFAMIPYTSSSSSSSNASYSAATKRLFSSPDEIPSSLVDSFDAILVLGGGVPRSIDHPPVYVERRCDDAVQVFQRRRRRRRQQQQQQQSGKDNASGGSSSTSVKREWSQQVSSSSSSLPILCLSAGTAHLPQLLSKDGLPIWESTACASYLTGKGIPSDLLYVETTSYDTIGNAFYTRTSHTDVTGWRRLLVITNEFHMDRTMAIFDWIFLDCTHSKSENKDHASTRKKSKRTKTTRNVAKKNDDNNNDDNYELYYLQSPNVGLTPEAVQARKEREDSSAKTVRNILAPKYTTLSEVYQFLTQDHSLYTAGKLVERARSGSTSAGGQTSLMVQQSYGAAGAGSSGGGA